MLAELAELMGESPELLEAAGSVDPGWREVNALQASPRCNGELADVEDLQLRGALEREHAALLAARHAAPISAVRRSRTRVVTQAIGRHLYDDGSRSSPAARTSSAGLLRVVRGRGELSRVGEPWR